MTSAPADWVRWLILILISVIIALAGQPVSSAAAASIVCAMAGAASRRPRGHDNWRLVMLPPSDDARRAGIRRRLQRLAGAWSPGHDSAGGPQPDRPAPARPLSRRLPSSLPASKRSPDMKLPRPRRSRAPETAEPASANPGAPVLQVLIFSNTDLPEQEFNAQRGKIRRVASLRQPHPQLAQPDPPRPPRMGRRDAQHLVRGRPRARHNDPGASSARRLGQPIPAGAMTAAGVERVPSPEIILAIEPGQADGLARA